MAERLTQASCAQSTVIDLNAAVFGKRSFVRTLGRRLFHAKADRLHLTVWHAEQAHGIADGLGTLLTKRQVVLSPATFVGMPFQGHAT